VSIEGRQVIILVDANGRRGVCSNCNQPAPEIVSPHSCGAEIDGVAINIEFVAEPSFRQGTNVNSGLPRGMAFVGAGRVLRIDNGYRFERTHNPGDLL